MSQASKNRAFAWRWISQDPEPEYREEIKSLLTANDNERLQELFGAKLQFGTAGLRGTLGPGPNRMNLSVIRRTSYGLASVVLESDKENPSIVIGYDARHRSREFAIDAAVLFRTAGLTVYFLDSLAATPLLAHAVVKLGCSAGVMITASHNPPQDNGYKVYWRNGAQIVPPIDKLISDSIDALPLDHIEFMLEDNQDILEVPEEIIDGYYAEVMALRVHNTSGAKIIYTPLHGVGTAYVETVLSKAGHSFLTVPEQREGNPDFPTVSFPNPEEPGAMDMAIALAESDNADIVIANDPDADRLAVAAKRDGKFKLFTGNQIGLMLADDLLKNKDWGDNPMVATTIVSSSQLKSVADAYNAAYAETLTGFKWIANEAIAHDASGGQFVMGFEEALGYSVGAVARDKDGVSASLLIADLASKAKSDGKTLWDIYDAFVLRYGMAASDLVSIKKPGLDGANQIAAILDRLRHHPPTELAGSKVVERRDYQKQKTNHADGREEALTLPKSNVLVFFLQDGARIIIRPSGTEPKIKFYYETQKKPDSLSDIPAVTKELNTRLSALKEAMSALLESIE